MTVGSGVKPDLLTLYPGAQALAGLSCHASLIQTRHHRRWGLAPRPENVFITKKWRLYITERPEKHGDTQVSSGLTVHSTINSCPNKFGPTQSTSCTVPSAPPVRIHSHSRHTTKTHTDTTTHSTAGICPNKFGPTQSTSCTVPSAPPVGANSFAQNPHKDRHGTGDNASTNQQQQQSPGPPLACRHFAL